MSKALGSKGVRARGLLRVLNSRLRVPPRPLIRGGTGPMTRIYQVNPEIGAPILVFAKNIEQASEIINLSKHSSDTKMVILDTTEMWLGTASLRDSTLKMISQSAIGIADYVADEGWVILNDAEQ